MSPPKSAERLRDREWLQLPCCTLCQVYWPHHHPLFFEQQKTWTKTRRNCGHSHSEPMATGSIGLNVPRMQELPQLTPLQQEL